MQPPAGGFRTFVIVWATQSVSVIGTALTLFAINIWLVQTQYPLPEQKPLLAAALSAINLAFALPTIILAPLAGAWADRHDRKRTMLLMDLASGCLSLLTAALLLTGTLTVWTVILVAALAAVFGGFHNSAFDTSYAMLVPERLLPRANGMMQTVWSLSGIISPALAAALIALPGLARQGLLPAVLGAPLGRLQDGTALAILADAVSFFLASATLLFVQIPSPKRADLAPAAGQPKKSIWADVREGAVYIWRRRPLVWLLGTFTIANFCSQPYLVMTPLILKFNLAGDLAARGISYEAALATLGSVSGIGGVAGGILISVWGGLKTRRVFGVLVPILLAGLAQVVFGISSLFYLTLAAALLINSMLPAMNSHSQAIWQAQTPGELQGRVFAVRRVIAQFSWPLSVMVAGLIGGVVNAGTLTAVLGAVLAVFTAAQLFNPMMLRVEDKATLDRIASESAGD